jgi:predicted nucleic-acid-binding protein
MIGIDTNILLRLATGDDARQLKTITRWLDENARGIALFINHVVLAETFWALKSSYGYSKAEQIAFMEALLGNAAIRIEEEGQVEVALHLFSTGKAEFPDCLIFAKNAHLLCHTTITFDRATRELPGCTVL